MQTALILLFAFLKSFRPGEPFLFPYLINDKHFSKDQINNHIFPVWDYAHWVLLPLMCLFAEWPFPSCAKSPRTTSAAATMMRYKVIMSMEALGGMATRLLLIYGHSLLQMQFMQIAFAVGTSADLMLHTFVFKAFAVQEHRKMTAYVRAAVLMGRSIGAVLGQLLVSYFDCTYRVLFMISAGSTLCACIICICLFLLPKFEDVAEEEAPTFDRLHDSLSIASDGDEKDALMISDDSSLPMYHVDEKPGSPMDNVKTDIIALLIIYSLNWAALFSVYEYGASLWQDRGQQHVYNGLVDFAACIFGVVGALLSWLIIDRSGFSERISVNGKRAAVIEVGLSAISVLMFFESTTTDLTSMYIIYVLMIGFFHLVSSTCSAWIGSALSEIGYQHAMVFGVAAFAGAGLKAMLQLIMTNLSFSAVSRFIMYTYFTLGTFLIALSYGLYVFLYRFKSSKDFCRILS